MCHLITIILLPLSAVVIYLPKTRRGVVMSLPINSKITIQSIADKEFPRNVTISFEECVIYVDLSNFILKRKTLFDSLEQIVWLETVLSECCMVDTGLSTRTGMYFTGKTSDVSIFSQYLKAQSLDFAIRSQSN